MKTRFGYQCSAICLAAALFGGSPSHAGFKWVPAPEADPGPSVTAAPLSPVESAPRPYQAEPTPVRDYEPSQVPARTKPIQARTAAVEPGIDATQPAQPDIYETVEGFGSDIPLVTAMSQVVPEGYAYSFDQSVNPGARISWTGGQPWNLVLSDAVEDLDLSVSVVGNTVWVKKASAKTQARQQQPRPPAAMTPSASTDTAPQSFSESMMKPAYRAERSAETRPDPAPQPARSSEFYDMMDEQSYDPSYPRRTPRSDLDVPPPPAFNPHEEFSYSDAVHDFGADSLQTQQDNMPQSLAPPQRVIPRQHDRQDFSALDYEAAPAPTSSYDQNITEPPAVLDPKAIQHWQARPGESLHDALTRWAHQSGVELVWNTERDFTLPGAVDMHATFADVVTQSLLMVAANEEKLKGELYPNLPMGPSVLIIASSAE